MDESKIDLGQVLKEYREQESLSQHELAQKLGTTESIIQDLEQPPLPETKRTQDERNTDIKHMIRETRKILKYTVTKFYHNLEPILNTLHLIEDIIKVPHPMSIQKNEPHTDKLKKIREILELTQSELAQKLEMSLSQIQKIENGKSVPSLKTQQEINELIDVINDCILPNRE